jgi:hypothetical protein
MHFLPPSSGWKVWYIEGRPGPRLRTKRPVAPKRTELSRPLSEYSDKGTGWIAEESCSITDGARTISLLHSV